MSRDAHILLERAWYTGLAVSGLRGTLNRIHYGAGAPRPHLRLTINPALLIDRYHRSRNDDLTIGHWRSGTVLPGDWDLARRPFTSSLKFRACRAHFRNGVPWDETRAIEYGLAQIAEKGKYDNCRSAADLRARYASLDDLWEKTRAAASLPFGASRGTTARTGILVHVDREGILLFGNQGFHRLAIAQLARLPQITVVVGVVHPDAISTGTYRELIRNQT